MTVSVPVVSGVPVMFLTAGGFTFTVPIMEGETTGLLLFSDRSMDRWLSGSGQEVVDPELYTRSAMTDGVFIPGLLSFGNAMSSAPPTDHATAGSVTGPRVHFRDSTITIGDESGAQLIALANLVKSELQSIATALASHTHSGVTTGTGTTGTSNSTYSASDVAASQAKAK